MISIKRIVASFMAVAVMAGSFAVSSDAQVAQAANGKAAKAEAAYNELLSKNTIKIGKAKCPKSDTRYSIKDLNNDGIPELVLIHEGASYGESNLIMATYYSGNVKLLFNDMWREDKVYSYDKGDLFYIRSQMGDQYRYYYTIKKGKLVLIGSYSGDGDLEKKEQKGSMNEYLLSLKKVSRKKFLSTLKKRTKNSKYSLLSYTDL